MTHIISFPPRRSYLNDGPIMLTPNRKAAMEITMGAELLEADAFRDRDDARRVLYASPANYARVDIEILVDHAMAWAYQAVVAAAFEIEQDF